MSRKFNLLTFSLANIGEKMFEKPYLSLDGACNYLSLSKATLYSWTSKKINLPFHKIGRKLLFKVSDLNEFIESNRIAPMSEIKQQALDCYISAKVSA